MWHSSANTATFSSIFYNGTKYTPGPEGWTLQGLSQLAKDIWYVERASRLDAGPSEAVRNNLQALEVINKLAYNVQIHDNFGLSLKLGLGLQYYVSQYMHHRDETKLFFATGLLNRANKLSLGDTMQVVNDFVSGASWRRTPNLRARLLYITKRLHEGHLKLALQHAAQKLQESGYESQDAIENLYRQFISIVDNASFNRIQKLQAVEAIAQKILPGSAATERERISLLTIALYYFISKGEMYRPAQGMYVVLPLLGHSARLTKHILAKILQDVYHQLPEITANAFIQSCRHLRKGLHEKKYLPRVLDQITGRSTTPSHAANVVALCNELKRDQALESMLEQMVDHVLEDPAEIDRSGMSSPALGGVFTSWSFDSSNYAQTEPVTTSPVPEALSPISKFKEDLWDDAGDKENFSANRPYLAKPRS